jgi:hypothetical protein
MPTKTKKRLARVEIVLADDKPRELLYTLEEIYEMTQLAQTETASDPRNFARLVQLGLRHAEPEITVEQVAKLIDAPNLDYYRECVNEASFAGNPTQAPAAIAARANGAPATTGSDSAHLPAFTSGLPSDSFGPLPREN